MGVVQVRRQPHKDNALVTVRQMLDVFFRPFRKQECYPGHGKTEFIYLIELPEGIDKRMYSDEMAKMGVPTRPYFNSLTKVPHLAKYAIHPTPVNDHVSARTIALPYHWKLTKKDVDTIATSHRCVLEKMRG